MRLSTKELSRAALMAALCAVTSQLTVPIGTIPFTLQTFAVALTGAVLGPRLGAISLALYLALGAVGVPVFAGLSGGLGVLIGPTGGFLMAFPAMAALSGLAKNRPVVAQSALALMGLVMLYGLGAARLAAVTGMSYWAAANVGILPFVIKDVISVIGAVSAARSVSALLARASA